MRRHRSPLLAHDLKLGLLDSRRPEELQGLVDEVATEVVRDTRTLLDGRLAASDRAGCSPALERRLEAMHSPSAPSAMRRLTVRKSPSHRRFWKTASNLPTSSDFAMSFLASTTVATNGLSMTIPAPASSAARPCSRCVCAGEARMTKVEVCARASRSSGVDTMFSARMLGSRFGGPVTVARRNEVEPESWIRRDEGSVEHPPRRVQSQ